MGRIKNNEMGGVVPVGVAEGYGKWAARYDQDPNPLIEIEENVVLELIGNVRGLRVLDLACGTGRYTARFAQQGAQATGIDLSAEMLAQAARKRACDRFALIRGSLERLCFADHYFDLVLSALALNHIADLECVLEEITRVVKPGGTIVISDFHPYWLVFGQGHTEFFDESGQEYRIHCHPHLFAEYWQLFQKFGLQLEELHEPKIDGHLIDRFPHLTGYQGVPLALIMKLSRPCYDRASS